ncbi:MAG: LacI family DNA-binding transcriptional regulator [Clostridium sp.]|uniref:LacI family DNA-binding transcriptional regulator n=1 Tax=Clostridium sp. TaxID=1506 RepID=UPI0025B93272|nr:LacI family DNA-binding transcriptional regulator [Clostridium sp.]MCF0146760.1 LacI family DNA-binding transcriptional regulator [Clostridium sp.]
MSKITIQDIANMCQVSKSSVSRYLNGGYVSKENKAKIHEAIEKTGFEENFFAKRLKTKKSNLIGVIIPRIDSSTVGKVLNGINSVIEKEGYTTIMLISNLSVEKELEHINSLYQQGVDGIIVDTLGVTKQHVELINKIEIPVICLCPENEYINCMSIDDYEAGRIMGKYFYNLNHRNIVFLGVSEKDKAVGFIRKKGFYDVFKESGEEYKINFVETDFTFNRAYEKGKEVMSYKPSAVVCATDNICLGLMLYLNENKISIPDEVSIAGFGGYDVGAVIYPPLTTIDFNHGILGVKSAEAILKIINGEEFIKDEAIPLSLIERKSAKEFYKE